MAQDVSIPQEPAWRRPWLLLLAGVAVTGLGLILSASLPEGSIPAPRLLLLASGLVLAGVAVRCRLSTAREEFEERLESAGLVAAAGGAALLAYLGMDKDWDSGRLVFGVLVGAALCGSVLVLCTGLLRRILLSLFVVFHFGGVLTAITMIPPPGSNQPAPFLPTQAWAYVYRPYLQFLFQNNAYHFYSPEPGPPTHLWFYLRYSDGRTRWFEMPKREDSPVYLHYQRLLSITEYANQVSSGQVPDAVLTDMYTTEQLRAMASRGESLQDAGMRELMRRRDNAAETALPRGLPYHPEVPRTAQYQAPQDYTLTTMASVVRRIARKFRHPADDPEAELVSVKMYCVRHYILPQQAFAKGGDPLDPTYFLAYFHGEFKPDGSLLNPKDPFLHWMIPIVRNTQTGQLLDFVHDEQFGHAVTNYNKDVLDQNPANEKRP